MYNRELKPPNHSFFLFGPRATGKTTWLRGALKAQLWVNLLLVEGLPLELFLSRLWNGEILG